MKKISFLGTMFLFASLWASAQEVPCKMVIPDVPGYYTLKGDMHVHTVFSDASVWPTTRVEEAMMEGLDFLAMTDHVDDRLQKQKLKGLFNCDKNESYKIAAGVAEKNGVIVIHGGEISRGMPPGHFNTTFIKDCNAIAAKSDSLKDHQKAMLAGLAEARKQGGFLVWNHPNWCRQAPNEAKWYKEHSEILKSGLMMGIEVFNQFEGFCKEGFHWAMKNNLTIVSGTDCHEPMFRLIDLKNGELRPVTLVFAKEKSEKGIKEAIVAGRTAVFAEGKVYGKEENILPLCQTIVSAKTKFSDKKISVALTNNSSIPVILKKAKEGKNYVYPTYVLLRPQATYHFNLYDIDGGNLGNEIEMPYWIDNFYTDADVNLKCVFKLKK